MSEILFFVPAVINSMLKTPQIWQQNHFRLHKHSANNLKHFFYYYSQKALVDNSCFDSWKAGWCFIKLLHLAVWNVCDNYCINNRQQMLFLISELSSLGCLSQNEPRNVCVWHKGWWQLHNFKRCSWTWCDTFRGKWKTTADNLEHIVVCTVFMDLNVLLEASFCY